MLERGYVYSLSTFSLYLPQNLQMSSGMICLRDGQIILHDPISSGCEEAATWIDPISRIAVPYQWRTWIRAKEDRLEAKIYAYGRSYYTWIRRGGTVAVNQFLGDVYAVFTYADGRTVEAKCMVSIEHMRTLYRQMNSFEWSSVADGRCGECPCI